MTHFFTLSQVGCFVGIYLILAYGVAAFAPSLYWTWLPKFPRSRTWGLALMAVAAAWGGGLIATVDLGEFAPLRTIITILAVSLCLLTAIFVPEFLAVRATGIIALLAAEPVLVAAFMRPELSRFLVVSLAYLWIICGLLWIGLPWLLRDQLTWVMASPSRFRIIGALGFLYGIVVLLCAFFLW